MKLYYEPRDEDDGTLWTAPRPLPGTKVGYRTGTGFALYRVEAAYLDEALQLDAQEVTPADGVAWAAIVEAAVVADGYSRAEYDENGVKVGKKKAGRIVDGRVWDEYPRGTR